MKIKILCVGKLKEKFYKDASLEYGKRLSRYCSFEYAEVSDEKAPENMSPAQKERIKKTESERLLSRVSPNDIVVALAIEGEKLSSVQFSKKLEEWMGSGKNSICFLVGGSLGLSFEAQKRADFSLSFSDMTFSHQIFRIMLAEQIYRAFKIINNEPYHK
jgi:23S rRNA (pseudouridine1915-N3)-methyltransferase